MFALFARFLNTLGILAVVSVLALAQAAQFFQHDLPCPLCLLQRVAFVGVMFGLMLNVIYGPRPMHYSLSMLAALFGAMVALRQVSLHVIPGTLPFGSSFFGWHFYTWSFVAFSVALVVLAIIAGLSWQYENQQEADFKQVTGFHRLVIGLALLMVLMNAVTTFVQCGVGVCVTDPKGYVLLGTETGDGH
ncbi:MAG: disulfide bond formation protein B [Pseudomonadota bacterium]